jgi:nucleotide-binding universal stress UspA family protein
MKRILIATDGSEPSKEAVEFGVELAVEHGANITFVHVIDVDEYVIAGRLGGAVPVAHVEPVDESETALNEAAEAARTAGVTFALERISAPTVDGIIAAADQHEADLIVVGSRGRGAITTALLGSVSRALVRRAARPVLVVKTTRVPVEA